MLNVTVDTKDFDKAFKEYMKYTKRSLPEACNQHAYYTARNAVLLTQGADKGKIAKDLMAPSREYAGVPLAAILVNAELGRKNKKGLTGDKMVAAVEKFIKRMQNHTNFVRSGWIPAIKILSSLVKTKGGSPIPPGTSKAGRDFGGATPATEGFSPTAWIWNSIKPKHDGSGKLQKILETGAQKAVDMETKSMEQYIIRKQNEIIKKLFG